MVREAQGSEFSMSSRAADPAPAARTLQADGAASPYVECSDLFKIFKPADLEVVALRGVDLEIDRGELMAIVGASGSGKTTLLNILAGLERPLRRPGAGGRPGFAQYLRPGTGALPTPGRRFRLAGYFPKSGALPQRPRQHRAANGDRSGKSIPPPAKKRELMAALRIEDKARRLPSQLSGGEQQRVAVGVGLANRPPLLLADEPTGELDSQMAGEIFSLLREINRAFGVTVVVVTHYPGVAQYVNRVVHIRDGRISSESFPAINFPPDGGYGAAGISGSGPGRRGSSFPGNIWRNCAGTVFPDWLPRNWKATRLQLGRQTRRASLTANLPKAGRSHPAALLMMPIPVPVPLMTKMNNSAVPPRRRARQASRPIPPIRFRLEVFSRRIPRG